jgi:hypothetical protein
MPDIFHHDFLPFDRATHAVAHQEDAQVRPFALGQVHCRKICFLGSTVSGGKITEKYGRTAF